MPLDAKSSDRLGSLRFPLIVGVVFIHAYGTEVRLAGGTVGMAQPAFLLDFLRNLLSQGIARVAVPTFFLMSGYFFFRDFSWSAQAYKSKLLSRGRTLLIPYLIWNFCGLMAIWTAQSLPATCSIFSGSPRGTQGNALSEPLTNIKKLLVQKTGSTPPALVILLLVLLYTVLSLLFPRFASVVTGGR